jgi:AAA15 family ATPase/GTPase
MLVLRFGLENYKCFRDYTEVSFISTAQQDEPSFRFEPEGFEHKILPVLGVFGANASGKTNLLEGLLHFVDLLRRSFVLQPSEKLPRHPWKPYEQDKDRLTRFDIDVLINGVRYHYGFAHSDSSFHEEWLYQWPRGRKQILFERHEADKNKWYFGPAMTGQKAVLSNATRPNSLFLATAAQYNHPHMGEIFNQLTQNTKSINRTIYLFAEKPIFSESEEIVKKSKKSSQIMKKFDLGIHELQFEDVNKKESVEELDGLFSQEFTNQFSVALDEFKLQPRLTRKTNDTSWVLSFSEESYGTKILLMLLSEFLATQGGLLIVDELSAHLHEEITHRIINTFTSSKNKKSIQLLFCDHDRSLMQRLRRDEILLVSKNEDGASSLASMADYKDLRARDDRQKVYESGQVGAVPILGDLDGLLED